jgi:hypothetical protein
MIQVLAAKGLKQILSIFKDEKTLTPPSDTFILLINYQLKPWLPAYIYPYKGWQQY